MIDGFARELFAAVFAEAATLTAPVRAACRDQLSLVRWFTGFGWNLEAALGANLARAVEILDGARADLVRLHDALDQRDETAMIDAARRTISDAMAHAGELHDSLQAARPVAVGDDVIAAFGRDLAGQLALHYLGARAPLAFQLAGLVGLVHTERAEPLYSADASVMLRYPIDRLVLDPQAIVAAAANPLLELLRALATAAAAGDLLDPLAAVKAIVQDKLALLRTAIGDRPLDDLVVAVTAAGVRISSHLLPVPAAGAPPIHIATSEPAWPTLELAADGWTVGWPAALAPGEALAAWTALGVGFGLPRVADAGSGLELSFVDGMPRLVVTGALEIAPPDAAIVDVAARAVRLVPRAALRYTLGGEPEVEIGPLTAHGSFQLGGAGGVAIRDATLELDAFRLPAGPWAAGAPPPLAFRLSGALDLAGGDVAVALAASYHGGDWAIESTGHAQLGAIRLGPVATAPVLRFERRGSSWRAAVRAQLDIPASGGTVAVEVAGTLDLAVTAAGLALRALDVRSAAALPSLVLPGDIALSRVSVALSYAAGGAAGSIAATLDGTARIGNAEVALSAAIAFPDLADPTHIQLAGRVSVAHLAIADGLEVFDAALELAVDTAAGTGRLALKDGSAGLIRRGTAAGSLDDFELAISGLDVALAVTAARVELAFTSGTLALPPAFLDAAAGRATLGLGSAAHPLVAGIDRATGELAMSGSLILANLRVRFPGAEDLAEATLASATLRFDGTALPRFVGVAGQLRLPLPDGTALEIDARDAAWDLRGLPTGTIELGRDVAIGLGGGVSLVLRGRDPANPAVVACGLTVERAGDATSFRIAGTVRLAVPSDLLSRDASDLAAPAGQAVYAEAGGHLAISTAAAARPELMVDTLAIGGTFRLGGSSDSLRIAGARLEATAIDQLFRESVDPANPFTLQLTGTIVFGDGGPELTLTRARFRFEGDPLRVPPRFDFGGIEIASGTLGQGLPVRVTRAGLTLLHDLPLPDALAPDNIEISLSAELALPLGGGSGLARVDRIVARLEHGVPHVTIGAIAFGVEDLELPATKLSGALYLGGLDGPPGDLVIAGKLGGSANGTGVTMLIAFEPTRPLGACLDVSGGSAGIPLGQTGFLLTGVSGGVSFANSTADPCAFTTYIDFDADGRPRRRPGPTAPAGSPRRSRSLPTARPVATGIPDCPGDCPPAAMNIFCQPHPDQDAFPGRAIVKFSSLDEDLLTRLGVKARIEALGSARPADLAAAAAREIRAAIDGLWPASVPVPPEQRHQLDALQIELEHQLAVALVAAGANRTAWELVRDLAYAGLPCPDVTLLVTATLSYAGVSAFASVTGGVSVSTAGSVGVLGWLNVFGMRVGRLRGFLTITSASGGVDPSICGDLRFVMGPLELGTLSVLYRMLGGLTDLAGPIAAAARELGEPVVRGLLARVIVDRARRDAVLADPLGALARLTGDEAVGLVARLLSAARGSIDRAALQRFFRRLLEGCWAAYNPSIALCGQVSPKIFGLPLGDDLVAVKGWCTKTELGAEFSFSPLYLLGRVFPLADMCSGMDSARFGFAISLPDPFALLDRDPESLLQGADQAAGALEAGLGYLLENAIYQFSYTLSPLGLKLIDAVCRATLPDLTHHPVAPGSSWRPPEQRGQDLPDRMEVLSAALASGKLSSLTWKGSGPELAELTFSGGRTTQGLGLARDYFPHGGLIGAARITMPRALIESPPVALLARLADGRAKPLERAQAALHLVTDYLLKTDDVGALTFYVPAPNPPAALLGDPRVTATQLMTSIVQVEVPPGSLATWNAYSFELAFLRGELHGQVLGVPLGDAVVDVTPPAMNPPREATLRISARAADNSWVRQIVDNAALEVRLRHAPPAPIEQRFTELAERLRTQPATEALLGEVEAALADGMPRAALEASVAAKLPAELRPWLRCIGSATLYAYSPRYAALPAGPVTATDRARWLGGIGLRARLQLRVAGLDAAGDADLSIAPTDAATPPRVTGTLQASGATDPAGSVRLADVALTIASAPPPGQPFLSLSAGLVPPAIDIGPLAIGGVRLCAAFHVVLPALRFDARFAATGFAGTLSGSLTWHGVALTIGPAALTSEPASPVALLHAVQLACEAAFTAQLRQREAWITAVRNGWIAFPGDVVELAHLMTRVFDLHTVAAIDDALRRAGFSAGAIRDALARLFATIPHGDFAPALHGDIATRHQDAAPTLHGDAPGLRHVDTATPHADTAAIPHGDVAASHSDAGNVGHVDVSASGHADTAAHHHDIGIGPAHGDGTTPHGDASVTPHADTPGVHGDVGIPHGDTAQVRHGDVAGSHADVPATPHGDVAAHGHADVPATHADIPATPHGDTPGGFGGPLPGT